MHRFGRPASLQCGTRVSTVFLVGFQGFIHRQRAGVREEVGKRRRAGGGWGFGMERSLLTQGQLERSAPGSSATGDVRLAAGEAVASGVAPESGAPILDEDRQVVEACRRGEVEAFKTLYGKYSRRVCSFARRFVGDEGHAEDVVQEVFLQVFRKLEGFRGDSKFSTWLFRVTVNSCMNKRRALEREKRLDQKGLAEQRAHGPELADPPERELGCRELRDEIDRALSTLSEEQRSLVLMKGLRGFSYEEIGEQLGQSENQVRGKLYRARRAFRAALADMRRDSRGVSEEVERVLEGDLPVE